MYTKIYISIEKWGFIYFMVLHKNWPILLLNHKQDYIETGGLQWGFRSGSRCQVGRHQDQSSGSSSSHRNWNASSSSWSRRNQPGLLKLFHFFIAKVFCFSFIHLTWSLFDILCALGFRWIKLFFQAFCLLFFRTHSALDRPDLRFTSTGAFRTRRSATSSASFTATASQTSTPALPDSSLKNREELSLSCA